MNGYLAVGFTLRCFQRLSSAERCYPAMLLEEQPVHKRFVPFGPLVMWFLHFCKHRLYLHPELCWKELGLACDREKVSKSALYLSLFGISRYGVNTLPQKQLSNLSVRMSSCVSSIILVANSDDALGLHPRVVSRRFLICAMTLPSPSKNPAIYAQFVAFVVMMRLPTVLPSSTSVPNILRTHQDGGLHRY